MAGQKIPLHKPQELGINVGQPQQQAPKEPLHSPQQSQPNMPQDTPQTTTAVIDKAAINKASGILQKYKDGKTNLEQRIIDNEKWMKARHWEIIRKSTSNATNGDPEPASAWLLNSLLNKHADAMDNFPTPSVLPREQGDKEDAKQLSAILPVVLEQNEYEQTYSDKWWYKLKTGTGVEAVYWHPRKNNGLGDIEIRQIDLLNLFWEPGIKEIQSSRNLFHVDLIDNEILEEMYPQLKGKLSTDTLTIAKYNYDDTVDTTQKSAVVDWYYKKYSDSKELVHIVKYVDDVVLYASENMSTERGHYDHGKYPFVFDVMFSEEGTPTGFGYIDIMKEPQMYIDKLSQILLRNAYLVGKPRYFVKADSSINETEFADFNTSFVHVTGNNLDETHIRPVEVKPLDHVVMDMMIQKIDELKETSGNRDFSQGGTSQGVTAASAIAALQEAGSKLSRDMIKSSYRAFQQVNYLCVELVRQFYDEPRKFRITGEKGAEQFVQFSNANIKEQPQLGITGEDAGFRMPIFDIKIKSQKSNPFSTMAQNELAKEFYKMGFFNPDMADQALLCMEMMDFEGRDAIMQKVGENGTLAQMVAQLQAQLLQLASIVDAQNGTTIAQGISQGMLQTDGQQPPMNPTGNIGGSPSKPTETNSLGKPLPKPTAAKDKALNTAKPT